MPLTPTCAQGNEFQVWFFRWPPDAEPWAGLVPRDGPVPGCFLVGRGGAVMLPDDCALGSAQPAAPLLWTALFERG